jgi:hypothetical protein
MGLSTLRGAIESAFHRIKRDEDCTLHQAQLLDDSMRREIPENEWLAAKDRDRETDWRDVPAAYLDECDAALSHATPASWHFYIPAFMLRALHLLDVRAVDDFLPGSVIFHLTYRGDHPGTAAYTLDRFGTLDDAQKQSITLFMEFIRDSETAKSYYARDAAIALQNYWGLDEQERPTGPRIILP